MSERLGILALDMATSTGWALMDREGNVTSGVQRFDLGRGESVGMRFLRFRRWLNELLRAPGSEIPPQRFAVDVIAYERAHHRGGAATALCVGLSTVVLEEAARLSIETTTIATMTLKKHATGRGNAGKPDMIAAASKRWGRQIETDDEADALCVLAWALDEVGQRPA